ncbi:BTAD domain-containing putative transcriptional regulator [Amycolatopsis sp. cg5]|uniref:AfsR/SARP family transcriptional regulator n=1 Tax=Amycolatopsis sp. cg5 TaxID=3238802 RepID=UPI0035238A16
MGLRLLGPPELVVGDRSLDLGGPRQRVVLSMLALNANRVTPVEQLIDAVWDTSPPSTARGQIQICISALRKLFGDNGQPGAIRTRPPGYLLEIASSDLDSEEFAAQVLSAREHSEAGNTSEAAETLRRALALWRGPALAGIPSDLVQRGAALLEDRRFAAVEERVRLDLALGRHERLSGEIQALIDENPLRERLYGFLMLALYRAGRQAEALEVCRRARATLIDEVGIEPGQELQKLERAILNRDPGLNLREAPAPEPALAALPSSPAEEHRPAAPAEQLVAPRQLPASIADFTGRERHLSEIKQILADDPDPSMASYAVRIVSISGKGGVGKSSLAIRAAHELAETFPDGHLYADLQSPNDDDRTAKLLARFLRALGVAGTAVPEDLQERAELYRSRLASKRLLVVLDDVTSEEQVVPLLPGSPSCAVITTSRARLSGLSGAHWVDVDVFDAEQSLELLGNIVGPERVEAEPESSLELVNFCDGLPLALRIAGARLASKRHWRISGLVRRLGDEAKRLDELAHRGLELRSNIGLTYRSLSSQAQRLFRLFALMRASDFPAWTAAALLDTDLDDAEDILETLVDAQVLDTVEYPAERVLRYRFHNLIRVYAWERLVEEETAAERDAALTRVSGAWLSLAETAHRKEYGGDFTILHGDAPRWEPPEPADTDTVGNPTTWWETERRALVAAIRQAAAAGLDELCWDLALTAVTLFESKGYFDDWRETTQLALDLTERTGNRRGHAAMLYSQGTLHMFQKRLDEAERCFRDALAIFESEGDRHGVALVLRNAAYVDRVHEQPEAMLDKYAKALDIMRSVDDRIGVAHVLCSLAKFRIDEGDADSAQEMLDDALTICQEVHCLRVEAQVLYRFADLYVAGDKIELARQALHRALRIVRDIGDRIGEAYALYGLGRVRHREGRLDNAETTLVHALSLAKRVGERLIEAQSEYALGEISLARGNTAAGAEHLAEARRLFDELGSSLWHAKTLVLLSEAHAAEGDVISASGEIDEATELLRTVESAESARWRTQLETARRALLTNGAVDA